MKNPQATRSLHPARRQRRRGVMSFELLLAIPVLLIVLIAGIEISQMLMAHQAIAAAAASGAREASMPGATETSVRAAVRRSVEGWRFEPALADEDITIKAMSLDGMDIPLASAASGDVVTVSIEIEVTDAVPDMLPSLGFSLAQRTLTAAAVLRKE
ncbi:MAG: hypothetical protein DWQ42_07410 [Planctomycetota bacterium]|nr:MAG: hypothetical protein DWQ42_07410 [Planctomycetota bacterium]REK37877.1 MAG: hypothetical protein DWQ46_21700 [Planctomycetota bacterium]